jgi:phosphoserine phosphatase
VLEDGRIAPKLARPLPYAGVKVELGRELVGQAAWLASFGDSASDLEMMQAAALGIAVRPRLALRMRLPELDRVWLLE